MVMQMEANTPQSSPSLERAYVPYFYLSGRFSQYLPARNPDTDPSLLDPESRDHFASTPRLFGPDGSPQTVEAIIRSGYFAVPAGEPETALISDKNHTARLGLEDVIGQIRSRYELFDRNLYEIELAKCSALNALFAREAEMGKPTDSRQEYSASKVLQNLYQQQREERVSLWQDVSKLKLALPELAQSYLTAYRKRSILNDDSEDAL